MSHLRIDNKTARLLWLTSQGLGLAPDRPLTLLEAITRLGFVQLDSIQIVARAHHHILWSRKQSYREPMLDQLLARDRSLFEHFTHDASVIPMEFLPYWERQFRRKKVQMDQSGWWKNLPNPAAREVIKQRIRDEGPLSTHAFDSKMTGPKEMWVRPPHKLALDYMWYTGELATSHRINFAKYYDLGERVFPQQLKDASPPDQDQINWLCDAALDRLGFGTPREVQQFWDAVNMAEVSEWLARSASLPAFAPVKIEVETADRQWVTMIAPANIEDRLAALKPPSASVKILNPFDPVIRDRARLKRLFGFEYRVEMFVPAAKREWGYYVFPILEGHRFIGRIEAKADRRKSVLNVLNFWPEEGVIWSANRRAKLDAELARMQRFVGVKSVEWSS